MRTIHIEFVGKPGSGKTTLAKYTLKLLFENGIHVDTSVKRIVTRNNNSLFCFLPGWKKILYGVFETIRNCGRIFSLLQLCLLIRPISFRSVHNIYRFIKLYIVSQAMKNQSSASLFLYDRGFINTFITVLLHKNFKSEIVDKALKIFYRTGQNVLVQIDLDAHESLQRIGLRPPKGDYRESLSDQKILHEYRLIDELEKLILDKFEKNALGVSLRIDGSKDPKTNAEEVQLFIQKHIST